MRFSSAIKDKKTTDMIPVIPDIKCVSPKHGDLLRGRCPVETAKLLKNAGATVMSVVTENKDFGGSLELLRSIAEATGLPVLRKDFITNADDLKISLDNGAAAILLMCATQTEKSLFELYEAALQLGLEPLVETHTFDEMQLAKKLGATLVGINNRDIAKLERDDGTVINTRRLAEFAPKSTVLISESGINTPEEARQAIDAGADAVLVGTALWQAADMAAFYQQLQAGGRRREAAETISLLPLLKIKICGLMRECDVRWCEELGVDVLGFVVEYPRDVPWNLTRQQAKELIAAAKRPTCIVTGGTPESIIVLVRELQPGMVQLHHKETVVQTAEIAWELKKFGIKTIKAVHDNAEIEELCATETDAILVDSRTAENAAKNSLAIDTGLFQRIKAKATKPLIIGGGITPENVCDIISRTGADWIDVMTGVEQSPGIKDKRKIETLIHRCRYGRSK